MTPFDRARQTYVVTLVRARVCAGALLPDRQRDRIVEIDNLFFAPKMDYPPEPILTARLPAVFHDQLGQIGDLARIHPQTTMRRGGAEALHIVRTVDVVIWLPEENLHHLHRIAGIPRSFRCFPFCPSR